MFWRKKKEKVVETTRNSSPKLEDSLKAAFGLIISQLKEQTEYQLQIFIMLLMTIRVTLEIRQKHSWSALQIQTGNGLYMYLTSKVSKA